MVYLSGAGTDKTADVVFKLHAFNSGTNMTRAFWT